MPNSANVKSERRKALSTLLQYAEHEAMELQEPGLAEIIRTAYLSMETSPMRVHCEIISAVEKKVHS